MASRNSKMCVIKTFSKGNVLPIARSTGCHLECTMFEHKAHPVLGRQAYFLRLLKHVGMAVALFLASLLIGVLGFMIFAGFEFLPALVDASMLLGGMGPVRCQEITSTSGHVFASFYALFCGIVFISITGIILAPVLHRFLHTLHFTEDEVDDAAEK